MEPRILFCFLALLALKQASADLTHNGLLQPIEGQKDINVVISLNYGGVKEQYFNRDYTSGAFSTGFKVKKTTQFDYKNYGPDGITYGCYGRIDPFGKLQATHYVADEKGYRLVRPEDPIKVYPKEKYLYDKSSGHPKESGQKVPWSKLFFPNGCGKNAGKVDFEQPPTTLDNVTPTNPEKPTVPPLIWPPVTTRIPPRITTPRPPTTPRTPGPPSTPRRPEITTPKRVTPTNPEKPTVPPLIWPPVTTWIPPRITTPRPPTTPRTPGPPSTPRRPEITTPKRVTPTNPEKPTVPPLIWPPVTTWIPPRITTPRPPTTPRTPGPPSTPRRPEITTPKRVTPTNPEKPTVPPLIWPPVTTWIPPRITTPRPPTTPRTPGPPSTPRRPEITTPKRVTPTNPEKPTVPPLIWPPVTTWIPPRITTPRPPTTPRTPGPPSTPRRPEITTPKRVTPTNPEKPTVPPLIWPPVTTWIPPRITTPRPPTTPRTPGPPSTPRRPEITTPKRVTPTNPEKPTVPPLIWPPVTTRIPPRITTPRPHTTPRTPGPPSTPRRPEITTPKREYPERESKDIPPQFPICLINYTVPNVPEPCPCYLLNPGCNFTTTLGKPPAQYPSFNQNQFHIPYGIIGFLPVVFVPYCPGNSNGINIVQQNFQNAVPVQYNCAFCQANRGVNRYVRDLEGEPSTNFGDSKEIHSLTELEDLLKQIKPMKKGLKRIRAYSRILDESNDKKNTTK